MYIYKCVSQDPIPCWNDNLVFGIAYSYFTAIVGSAEQIDWYGTSKGNMAVAVRVNATYETSDGKMGSDFLLGGQLDVTTEISQTCQTFQSMNIDF